MPKYVVHVGMPKTGSTYLQVSLQALAPQLAERGVLYPSTWWSRRGHSNHIGLFSALISRRIEGLDRIFAGFNASGNRCIVFSAEGLSGLTKVRIAPLRTLIGDNPCEIVVHVRRWSDWIPSHWQQRVKGGAKETFPELCAGLLQEPFARPIDFTEMLETLTDVFGHDALHIVSYSNAVDAKVDLVRQFCSLFLDCADLDPPAGAVHESLTIHDTELNRCMNALEAAKGNVNDIWFGRALRRNASDPELMPLFETVFAAMKKHEAVFELNDDQPMFTQIFHRVMERWGDRIVNPHPEHGLFERRRRAVRYVSAEYMLMDGVREALLRLNALGHDRRAQLPRRGPRDGQVLVAA